MSEYASSKKDRHRRSVETLGLSSHGDITVAYSESFIQQIKTLIDQHSHSEPYATNTMHRIAMIVSKWEKEYDYQ